MKPSWQNAVKEHEKAQQRFLLSFEEARGGTCSQVKNALPVVALAILVMVFASCKKDYNCICSYRIMNTTEDSVKNTVTPVGKTSKRTAQNKCNYIESNLKAMAGYFDVTCGI